MSNEKVRRREASGLVGLPAEYVATEAVTLMVWLLCCAVASRVHKSL
ncbi:MAG: hypothetical protein ACO2PM_14830 [Pyrobaculum sp.]